MMRKLGKLRILGFLLVITILANVYLLVWEKVNHKKIFPGY
jgi:hypothetical protein